MRITIGRGNSAQSVIVPQGKPYRTQDYHQRQRFQRDFCKLAGIDTSKKARFGTGGREGWRVGPVDAVHAG